MAGERVKLKRDSRCAWLVCLATVIVHLVVCGILNNFGLLYIYIVNELGDGGKAKSAWVGSLSTGIMFIIGPLVTASCDRVGCRVTGIVGGLVGAAGLVCSSFTKNIYLLYATYGVAMGVGCGACYITTMKVLSLWFVRRLALANCFTKSGAFLGNLVIAPCLQRMLARFGLAGSFLCLAGLFSINSLMAVFYRTPERTREKTSVAETKSKKTGFDFTVLKHKSYVFYLIGSNIISVAWPVTYVHLPAFAKEEGIPEAKVPLLMTIDALSGLSAALCFGRIVDYFSNSHLQFYQLSILGIGLVQTFLATAKTFPSFIVLVIFHGISTAVFIPLRPVLVEEILGKDRASEGIGFLCGMLGFAYIAGPPLVGWIYDVTLSYPTAFFVTGGLCVVACCILSLVPLPQRTIDVATVSSSQDKSRFLLVDETSQLCQEGTPNGMVHSECNNTHMFQRTRETDV